MKKTTLPILFALLLLSGCADTGAAVTPAVSDPPASPPVVTAEPEHEPEAEPEHEHAPAEEPAAAGGPEMLYCGNTVTTITVDGQEYSFWGDDSVALTDLLTHLTYDPNSICRCLPEYDVSTEFGSYGVNLSQAYARDGNGQAPLTSEQVELIQGILENNCA